MLHCQICNSTFFEINLKISQLIYTTVYVTQQQWYRTSWKVQDDKQMLYSRLDLRLTQNTLHHKRQYVLANYMAPCKFVIVIFNLQDKPKEKYLRIVFIVHLQQINSLLFWRVNRMLKYGFISLNSIYNLQSLVNFSICKCECVESEINVNWT